MHGRISSMRIVVVLVLSAASQVGYAQTNVARGRPVTLMTNGAEDVPCERGICGHEPADVTDGGLDCRAVSADAQDGCVAWKNSTMGRSLEVTVRIDLGRSYRVQTIRYHMGNSQRP